MKRKAFGTTLSRAFTPRFAAPLAGTNAKATVRKRSVG
jgi:hypothetical protein